MIFKQCKVANINYIFFTVAIKNIFEFSYCNRHKMVRNKKLA